MIPTRSAAAAALVALAFTTTACAQSTPAPTAAPTPPPKEASTAAATAAAPAALPPEVEDARRIAASMGIVVRDLAVGTGPVALPGSIVRVHYTGWLYEPSAPETKGTKFDSSLDRGEPFVFPLGAGRVIRGWDLGVAGMQPGGKRRLVIPASLAYGDGGAGGVIPPGATLVFDVELLGVRSLQ
jgi:FKBP-type peptidyl-prolyl cis-trans isomerase